MMTAIALINRPHFQGAVAGPTAVRANLTLRPAPLKKGISALRFRPIMRYELTPAKAFLKLDFVFHDVTHH
jgi:hypothetical protein